MKLVTVSGNTVYKVDHPASLGRVAKQSARLRELASLGYRVAHVLTEGTFADGRTWAVHERIHGLSLADCSPLSREQSTALQALASQMVDDGLYIGDLNHRNLIWENGDWVVIDCGAVRRGLGAEEIRARLHHKWRKVT